MQGPALFLAQFMREEAPFNTFSGICRWAAELGYRGVQIPVWEKRLIDLDEAAESESYCHDWKEKLSLHGLELTELNAALPGQVLAMHPAYAPGFQSFFPAGLDDRGRIAWATDQLMKTIRVAARLGTKCVPVLSGGFAWHLAYPWPQRPDSVIDEAFAELARRWLPILNVAREHGVKLAFELHPGSDVFDGHTLERFLTEVNEHSAVGVNYDPSHLLLQQLDYLEFIRLYGSLIRGFHVKDAEFRPDGRGGLYGGYLSWRDRPGRFRSLGDGQIDFKRVFTLLTEAGYRGWAVLEWECAVKAPAQGAREGVDFIRRHLIEATPVAFDESASGSTATPRQILGLD